MIERPKTGFDKYVEEQMTDPEFAAGYEKAQREVRAALQWLERQEQLMEPPDYALMSTKAYFALHPDREDAKAFMLEAWGAIPPAVELVRDEGMKMHQLRPIWSDDPRFNDHEEPAKEP
jgi:hypothetical protein